MGDYFEKICRKLKLLPSQKWLGYIEHKLEEAVKQQSW